MKLLAAMLIVLMLFSAVQATTREANFLTEFDIVFWQSLPFVTFWGYAIGTQIASGGAVNWSVILPLTVAVSAANAAFYAKRVTAKAR